MFAPLGGVGRGLFLIQEVTLSVPDQIEPPADAASELVHEYFDSAGQALRSDPTRGVLRGVKLLGLRSRNGRRYAESALRQAVSLYEGSKVNVNHPARDPLGPRDYRDRLGVVRNARLELGSGLFGDLHYNPKHPLAEQLSWDAEHAPQNVGLSHNVLARTRRDGGETVVEAITRVQSVDLVADPATTSGLFEAADTAPESQESELIAENTRLHDEVNQLTEQLNRLQRRARIDSLLIEHGIGPNTPDEAVSEAFLRQLMAADEDDLAQLVEERSRLVHRPSVNAVPESRERREWGVTESVAPASTADFVEAISRRVG